MTEPSPTINECIAIAETWLAKAPCDDFEFARRVYVADINKILLCLRSRVGDGVDAARLDYLEETGAEASINADPEGDKWSLHRVQGGRNDREWRLISTGATVREVIDAGMAHFTKERT